MNNVVLHEKGNRLCIKEGYVCVVDTKNKEEPTKLEVELSKKSKIRSRRKRKKD